MGTDYSEKLWFLEVSKARLDGAFSSLIQWVAALAMAEGLELAGL